MTFAADVGEFPAWLMPSSKRRSAMAEIASRTIRPNFFEGEQFRVNPVWDMQKSL